MSLFDIIKPRQVQIGCIKIGRKQTEKPRESASGVWYAPVKLDHFLITTMNRDGKGQLIPDDELMRQLQLDYGDKDGKLRRIPIRVLSNDPEDIMQSAYCWYGGRTVGARSDGREITWFNDPKSGKPLTEPVTEPFNPAMLDLTNSKGVKLLKVHTVFNCVVAAKDSRWGGVYKLRTTSSITASQLLGSLVHLKGLTGGVLQGLPLQLVIRPIQVAPLDASGNKVQSTVYVVHIELRGADLQQIQAQALETAKYQLGFKREMEKSLAEYRQLLAPPGSEAGHEAAEINEEFQPETVEERIETTPDMDPLLSEQDANTEESHDLP